jgi:hypothetical protein
MKKIRLAIILLIICYKYYSQTNNNNSVWIREDFVYSVDISNDTLPIKYYTSPFIGFSGLFSKKMLIRAYHSDLMIIPKESYQIINKTTIKINNYLKGFLTDDFFEEYKVKFDKSFYGLMIIKNDRLILQLYSNKKVFKEFYFVNHYKDYYFKDLTASYKYLYKLKYKD